MEDVFDTVNCITCLAVVGIAQRFHMMRQWIYVRTYVRNIEDKTFYETSKRFKVFNHPTTIDNTYIKVPKDKSIPTPSNASLTIV